VRAKAVAALLLSVATAAGSRAQSPPPRPVFGARTDLVYVTVTVQDAHGKVVPDLPDSAFEIREDGKPRDIQVFSRGADERVALDVALLLDTSGSMDAELQNAQRAALAVLLRIPRLRRRTVVSFDTDIRFWRADAEPVALLPEILAARPPNGASAVRSAVVAAIDALVRDGSGRGALILLSDGDDVGSAVTETQLFRAIESANVAIYPIPFVPSSFSAVPDADLRRGPAARLGAGFPTTPDTLRARGFLTRMAETSGGRVLVPTGHLGATLDSLVEELSSQYVIGFTPAEGPRGRAHRLDVRVADKKLKVRYRERYIAR
jgi:VWFA-related protein